MSSQPATSHALLASRYIGLMSGTSLDGVDGVILSVKGQELSVLAHHNLPFPQELRAHMLALNRSGADELHRAALAANALTELYAQVVAALLYTAELDCSDITAIGAHGQTVRHRPELGYTWQLNNPARLAERTGITVVADFRSRDVAAGGQGAPLVPVFHQAAFAQKNQTVAVLNIGGIANVSLLNADGSVIGFDTGPGNVLLDVWVAKHQNTTYDKDGAFAQCGEIMTPLLKRFLADPYFSKPLPKSTGRDLFDKSWLDGHVDQFMSLNAWLPPAYIPACVQATLVDLTAQSIVDALQQHQPNCTAVYVCGGGALNGFLMQRLQTLLAVALPKAQLLTTGALGIPVMQVEAAAFAWLASKTMQREALDLTKITGSRAPRVLGAIYSA